MTDQTSWISPLMNTLLHTREDPLDKDKQEEAKAQVASIFADTFHNMSKHGLQINMQKQPFKVELFVLIQICQA